MYFLRVPFIAALLLLAGPALLGPAPAIAGRADLVDVSIFYEDLNEGGDWFEHPRHGYVWSPDVDRSWRPYSRGRWIYTSEYGWFWDSDEPFGWAVYHYGRWGFDEADGWYWVPGRRWGPAWVAWRYGDEYAGWAPLPPGAVWSPEFGIVHNSGFHISVRYDPYWLFVRPQFLVYNNAHRFAHPRSRNRYIFKHTRPAVGYDYVKGRMFNHGIGPRHYRRIARRSVPRTRIYFYQDNRPFKHGGWSRRGSVRVFRPGKKRRYAATRAKAPRVLHKTSPRRAAWKRDAKRPTTNKPGTARSQSWRAKQERRKARTQTKNVTMKGGKQVPGSRLYRKGDGGKRKAGETTAKRKEAPTAEATTKSPIKLKSVKKERPKPKTKAVINTKPPSKPKSSKKARSKRKAAANNRVRPRRKAKPASSGAQREKRAVKVNGKRTGNGKRKEKATD